LESRRVQITYNFAWNVNYHISNKSNIWVCRIKYLCMEVCFVVFNIHFATRIW